MNDVRLFAARQPSDTPRNEAINTMLVKKVRKMTVLPNHRIHASSRKRMRKLIWNTSRRSRVSAGVRRTVADGTTSARWSATSPQGEVVSDVSGQRLANRVVSAGGEVAVGPDRIVPVAPHVLTFEDREEGIHLHPGIGVETLVAALDEARGQHRCAALPADLAEHPHGALHVVAADEGVVPGRHPLLASRGMRRAVGRIRIA